MSKLGNEFKVSKRKAHKDIDRRLRTKACGTAADYRKLGEVKVDRDHARPGDGYRVEGNGHAWRGARGKEKRVHTPR